MKESGAAERGFEGDMAIGATALDLGIPLVTGDRALAQAIAKLGGEARLFRQGGEMTITRVEYLGGRGDLGKWGYIEITGARSALVHYRGGMDFELPRRCRRRFRVVRHFLEP